MNKYFILIELLAVIVILAIIALITTPIVLNIINDAKSESELRNADFYLDALELSIAQATLDEQNITDNTYNILDNGNICLEYENTTCEEELKVEVKEATPTDAQKGLVIWINQEDYESVGGQKWNDETHRNIFGPITAMNFLREATKACTNTNEIKTSTIEYKDGNTYKMGKTYKTNARMAYYSEVESVSSDKV